MEGLAGRVILLWGWKRWLTAFVAGALAALSQAPFDFFAVCFVSFPLVVWLLDGTTSDLARGPLRRVLPYFSVGWWFGFGYFLAGLWWTGVVVMMEADTFAWALPFAVLGLPALLAVFYGLATLAARLLWSEGVGRIAALAFAFGLAEWLRATVLTGFPWNTIGYAAMPVPLLMQSDRLTGIFGMSVLAVFVFAAPALLGPGPRRSRIWLAAAAILIIAHPLYGYVRLARAPASDDFLDVRIVQPSIDQTDKWDSKDRARIFDTYVSMSAAPAASGKPEPRLIVWPETAIPFLLTQHPEALEQLSDLVKDDQTLLVGAVRSESGGPDRPVRYYNSALAIDTNGEIADAVDKIHLVPFGEYVPFGDLIERLGIRQLVEAVGPFSAGAVRHPITIAGGLKAAPFICYEIIFPRLVDDAVPGADFMVNLTNDAWFGYTPGPYQHFRQAQLRAVETGLPLLRAANNGISAVVDGHGRVVDALALDAVGTLDVKMPLRHASELAFGTPAVNGLAIMLFFGLFALGLRLRSRFRSN